MPILGEFRKGREIGKVPSTDFFAWTACIDCGKLRWVYCIRKKPISLRCRTCSSKRTGQILHERFCYTGKQSVAYKSGKHKTVEGYIKVLLDRDSPFYSMADSNGYVSEHRLVMAKKLGRPLARSEHVHHLDGNKANNNEENLQLVSRASHQIYDTLCKNCPLRKEIRLIQFQNKLLLEQVRELNLRLIEDNKWVRT